MKKAICIFIVFITLLSTEIISQEGWFWQNPFPQEIDFSPDNLSFYHSIYFSDYNHRWAVGSEGINYGITDRSGTWIESNPKPGSY